VVAAALSGALLSPFGASAIELTDGERSALTSGRTVKKPLPDSGQGGFFGGSGFALVDAPPEQVWAAIEDWGSYTRMFPKTVEVREVARKGDTSLIYLEQGHQLLSIGYHVEVDRDQAKRMISFSLVTNKPHDIDDTRGYWRLFPQADGKTLVAYVVAVRVPMGVVNLLGESMCKRFASALLDVPGSLKRWLEGPNGSRYRAVVASR
jgi:carbon monoxide dehydrogenase subunit G